MDSSSIVILLHTYYHWFRYESLWIYVKLSWFWHKNSKRFSRVFNWRIPLLYARSFFVNHKNWLNYSSWFLISTETSRFLRNSRGYASCYVVLSSLSDTARPLTTSSTCTGKMIHSVLCAGKASHWCDCSSSEIKAWLSN